LMKRPADKGKGLEGVAKRAPGYVNPAIDLLEEGASR
jgi:beta-lysine 5,6-aminomutase alpha subunit